MRLQYYRFLRVNISLAKPITVKRDKAETIDA